MGGVELVNDLWEDTPYIVSNTEKRLEIEEKFANVALRLVILVEMVEGIHEQFVPFSIRPC